MCLAVLVIVARPVEGEGPLPNTEPLPPGLLAGRILTLAAWNCSIETPPGSGWTWLRVALPPSKLRVESYICYNSETDARFILQATESSEARMSDRFAANVVDGMRRGAEKNGAKFADVSRQPSERPLPGSFRISATLTRSSGESVPLLCYLGAAGNSYVLQTYARSDEEPLEFKAFVGSFRLLKPVPKRAAPDDMFAGLVGVIGFLIVLVFAGLGGVVNRIAGRPTVNGAALGGVLIMLLAIGLMVFVATRPGFGDLDAEHQGEALGGVLGMAVLPLLLAFFLGWRYRKKARQAAARQEQVR